MALFFLLISNSSFAAGAFSYRSFACPKELEALAQNLGVSATSPWSREVTPEMQIFKVHGKKFAEWIVVQANSKQESTLIHFMPEGKTEATHFRSGNCALKKVDGHEPVATGQSSPSDLTDATLEKLLTRQRNGLIYAWSPNMALSIQGIAEVKAAAADLGLPLLIAMDPLADAQVANDTAKNFSLPQTALLRLNSQELGMRSMLLHYPALAVYKNGAVCDTLQRGYRTHAEYRKIATEIFGMCK